MVKGETQMKCPECGGVGRIHYGEEWCSACNGTGEIQQTEQEYIQSCNTEQLVHVIHLMTTSCYVCGKEGVDYKRCYFHKKCTGPKEIEEWLKEPHDPFE